MIVRRSVSFMTGSLHPEHYRHRPSFRGKTGQAMQAWVERNDSVVRPVVVLMAQMDPEKEDGQ
ncbi:hypothetical protein AA15973_0420 [Komagataeibacter sucrofermentans DSM 15973]|nr:hypothetical protein AA15973_0420 [Komagataeibacter sucrofermentans DSM 15973]